MITSPLQITRPTLRKNPPRPNRLSDKQAIAMRAQIEGEDERRYPVTHRGFAAVLDTYSDRVRTIARCRIGREQA